MHPRGLKKKEANVSAMEERSQTEIDYVELKSGLTTGFVSTASIPARKFSTASELADFVHVSTSPSRAEMKSANGDKALIRGPQSRSFPMLVGGAHPRRPLRAFLAVFDARLNIRVRRIDQPG